MKFGCWLCASTYTPSHFNSPESACNGLQFSNGDTLEEALKASGMAPQQIDQLLHDVPQRIEEARARERRRTIAKIILYILLSPLLLVCIILILPFVGAWLFL